MTSPGGTVPPCRRVLSERGSTMLVKAKWNVKDAGRWHMAGDVFQTETDLGDAAEVLEQPKAKKQDETPAEKQAEVKPKTTRRKKTGE